MLERVWRKGNPPTLLVGMYIGAATVEDSMEVSEETKIRTTVWLSISTSGYISENHKNTNLKRYVHPSVPSSIIYSCQDKDAP